MSGRYPVGVIALVLSVVALACGGGKVTETATPTLALRPSPTPTSTPTMMATPISTPTLTVAVIDPVALGKSLSARNGCLTCHSIDGNPGIGPTWRKLYGTVEALTDGSTMQVDDAYLRESIVDPNARIVKGFTGDIMPNDFDDKLSQEQILAIISYIKTLK